MLKLKKRGLLFFFAVLSFAGCRFETNETEFQDLSKGQPEIASANDEPVTYLGHDYSKMVFSARYPYKSGNYFYNYPKNEQGNSNWEFKLVHYSGDWYRIQHVASEMYVKTGPSGVMKLRPMSVATDLFLYKFVDAGDPRFGEWAYRIKNKATGYYIANDEDEEGGKFKCEKYNSKRKKYYKMWLTVPPSEIAAD